MRQFRKRDYTGRAMRRGGGWSFRTEANREWTLKCNAIFCYSDPILVQYNNSHRITVVSHSDELDF